MRIRRYVRRLLHKFDGHVTFGKSEVCPPARARLWCSSPRALPSQAHGGRKSLCHPGHVAFVAESVVELKAGCVELRELVEASRENARVPCLACNSRLAVQTG